MCGIFCTAGDLIAKQDNFMYDMFVMDSLRGMDSCGLLTVKAYGEDAAVFKKAMLPHDYLDSRGYAKLIKPKNKVMVGHNRWATKGTVNHVNAHPFTVGSITGVHNGTLAHQYRLPDSYQFDVDSENIMHAINKIGIEETWKLVDGAAALMWWDAKANTFNFIRNAERPLFFCYSKDLKQMYAASEKFMLMSALHRNGIEHHQIETLPINTLYSFEVDIRAKKDKDIVKCSTRKLEPFRAPYVNNTYNRNNKGKAAGQQNIFPIKIFKAIGEKVDFIVDEIGYTANMITYHVIDNSDGKEYQIESYAQLPFLEEDELATGTVSRKTGSIAYLGPHSVIHESAYEIKDTDENNLPVVIDSTAIVLDEKEEMTTEDWDKLDRHDCDWCASPIEKDSDYLLTEQGQLFCDECKDSESVKPFVNGEKVKV